MSSLQFETGKQTIFIDPFGRAVTYLRISLTDRFGSMTRALLEDMLPESQPANQEDTWGSLSEREQEVIKMVALGHTSAEIAAQLNLSAKTVETYRARGMENSACARAPRWSNLHYKMD